MGPFPGGPPAQINVPSAQGPGPASGGGSDGPDNPTAAKALDGAIMALEAYLKAEKDPQDKAIAAQLLAKAHGLQAGRAKEQEAAMGTSPAMKFISRQSQGA